VRERRKGTNGGTADTSPADVGSHRHSKGLTQNRGKHWVSKACPVARQSSGHTWTHQCDLAMCVVFTLRGTSAAPSDFLHRRTTAVLLWSTSQSSTTVQGPF
jgi:hypothetical protein